MKTLKFISLFFIVVAFVSCNSETGLSPASRGDIIELEEKGTLSLAQIIKLADQIEKIDSIATHQVKFYELTYRTTFTGKPIDTKALLLVPQNISSPAYTAYFHGTIPPLFEFINMVPSNFKGDNNFVDIGNITLPWASAGYAVIMPDYIGYRATKDKEHPYLYFPEMFISNIDGLIAGRKALQQLGYQTNNDIFLSGWSQGGAACLSTHRYIQEQYPDQFTVVASSGLAGPYNLAGMVDTIMTMRNQETGFTFLSSWIIYSLNKFSDIKRPTDQIFSYPVFDQGSAINVPSNIPNKIFNPYFLSKIIDHSDVEFRRLFNECSFHQGWHPQGKVFFHHGDADDVVFVSNTYDAYNGLENQGADVKKYIYPGGKHDTELENYMLNTLNDFNSLK